MHRSIYLALLCAWAAASCENATTPDRPIDSTPQPNPAEAGLAAAKSLHSTPLTLEVSRDGDKDKVRVVGLPRGGYISGVSFYPSPSQTMPPFPSVNRSSLRVRCNKGVIWIGTADLAERARRGHQDGFGVRVKVQFDGHDKTVPELGLPDRTVRVCKQGSY